MCLQVFAAASEPLPIIEYGAISPMFQTDMLDEQSLPVVKHFTKPHVYILYSVGGCACGFNYGRHELDCLTQADTPDEIKANALQGYAASLDSMRAMREYLRVAATAGAAEVYACWYGEEAMAPETRENVTLDYFGGEEFAFVERRLLTVTVAEGE